MHMLSKPPARPSLWTRGDWNAFFGFGTNLLINLLTLTGLMRVVVGLPDAIVFGRILPAAATMMALSAGYYAYLAHRLARRTGRTDVCALPSGVSVPHMFVVTFVVMLPVKRLTGDAILAWQAGVAWVFVQSFVLIVGAQIAPWLRRVVPRPALLGALAGVSLTFIAMGPALQVFETPMIGLPCLAIVLAGWFGGVRFGGAPAGLVLVIVGSALAWGSTLLGPANAPWGGLSVAGVRDAVAGFGLHWPHLDLGLLIGGLHWSVLGVVIVTAIPFGLYDLVEAMDNVVSASAAGDEFPTVAVLSADGIVSLIGCALGSPFVNAVYIGHPGWKAMGGRTGYAAAAGLAVLLVTGLGLLPLTLALIPTVALAPVLLYVGLLIGAQAFAESTPRQMPAVLLAMLPALAAWAKGLIDNALVTAGAAATHENVAALARDGVYYNGLSALGGGSILAGIQLGAIAYFAIERQFRTAAVFCVVTAILTFVGLVHGSAIGLGRSPSLTGGYIGMAAVFAACWFARRAAADRLSSQADFGAGRRLS